MDSAPAATGWKKRSKLTRKERIKLGLLQEKPGQSGEPAKQGVPGQGKKKQQVEEQTESQKKWQKAQMQRRIRLKNQADLQGLLHLGYSLKRAKRIVYQNKLEKCKICFVDVNKRNEHEASTIHKDASAFRKQCVFEARRAPTLQEIIDETDKEIAEWIMAKKEKSKQEKKDKKVVHEGSPKKEAVGKEVPIVGAVDMEATNREAPDMETSNMAAPDGEGPSTEISNMVAPNSELSDMEISDVAAPDKESSHVGAPKETSVVGASKIRAPDESFGVGAPKKTSNMKTSDMGAPNMESSVVKAPNMRPLDKGERKMEASEEGAPDKGLSDMGAPEKESSSNEVPVKKPFDKEKFFREVAIIGLEYIVEYLPSGNVHYVYACNLCQGVFSKRNIYYHVQSIQHRIFYLATHHKGMGVSIRFQVNSRHKYKELVDCAQQVEKKYGRKSIKIANKAYVKPDRKDPQERKNQAVSPGQRHPAPRGNPRIDRDSEFARLGFAKAVMMERDLLRARGFSRRDLDERLMEIEGFHRSGVGSVSQEDLMKRRLASDGRYPMMEKDPMMRRRFPMMELEMTMRRRASGGKYPMSQEDLIMCHTSSEGQRTQDDVMEVAGLPHGFRDSRPAMSREGAALRQPGSDAQTRMSEEASTMHRDANDGRFALSQGGDMKQPAPGNVQALAFLKSLENRYSTTVTLAQELPSTMSQKLDAFQHAVVVTSLTKSDQGKTFRELKASHGNEKRGLAKRWESTEGGIGKDPQQCEVDDFWCNDELYDFLANFVVESKEDVEYLLKITNGFANALVRYRKRAEDIKIKIQEEKKKLEEEKIAFLRDPGVRAIKKVIWAHEKEKRAMSSPAGAPVSKQARTNLSSSAKPLFPSASSLTPASDPQVKSQMALSFDSYQPAGYTESYSYGNYGYQGYNYNTSYPSSEQRPSFGAATSRPPDSQSHQPPASMGPAYNMPQGKWSNQMPPRKDTYPPGGPGDGSSAAKLPTGY